MERPRWTSSDTAVTVVGVVMMLALTFPGYAIANRVEPMVLGLPFSLAWVVGWIALGGIALLAVFRSEYRGRGRQEDE